ncbi:MAG: HAD family hydrolase [bacterium]
MSRPRPLVIFDVDGVLVDTSAANVEGYQAGCRAVGIAVPEPAQVRTLLGLSFEEMARQLGCPPDRLEAFRGVGGAAYRRHVGEGVPVYPGVPDLLSELSAGGVRLAAWTTGAVALQEMVLKAVGLRQWIAFLHAHGMTTYPKPDPRGLREIVAHFPESAPRFLVDDRGENLLAGREINALEVFAAYGFGAPPGSPPHAVVHTPGEILDLVDPQEPEERRS